jgi:NgoFVII restriction endonuclease N-terminal PLD domain
VQYIDTASRDPRGTLGAWLDAHVVRDSSVNALRWQTGFFGAGSLGYFAALMTRLRASDRVLHVLVGSNDGATTRSDLETLLVLAGPPRKNQRIGIVSFENAYFHSKTIHLAREDDSSAAYVGSANLTGSGVTSLHVEAGIVLDTRKGDDPNVLAEIAAAVDWWFQGPRQGLNQITAPTDLDGLVSTGVLNVPRPVLAARPSLKGQRTASSGGRLAPLVKAPPLPAGVKVTQPATIVALPPAASPVVPTVGAPSKKTVAAQWGKTLTRSDAQRKAVGNQRGSITLTRAGHQINAQTYFRRQFFSSGNWVAGITRTGEPREIAVIPFEVTFLGSNLGTLPIEVSFAPNREATQANYTSLLHLGTGSLAQHFIRRDVEGRWLELKRRTDGTYSLSIS